VRAYDQKHMSSPQNDGVAQDPIVDTHNPEHYKIGTLTYTKAGIVALFLYLLWGDFCFSLMEGVLPNLLPIDLSKMGASNWTIGLLMTALPQFMTLFVNPAVSFRSDRFRSRWGRRIPFLAVATPFVVVFLVLLGYGEQIGRALHHYAFQGKASELTVVLTVVCVMMICFQFFNSFITSIYYYLFNDVVPRAFLARMMTLFRTVGSLASISYNFFVFPYSEHHTAEIFLGAALLYLVGFTVMCWNVKEGKYPPPPENIDHRTGFIADLKTYGSECFKHRFYWLIFLANASWSLTWVSTSFGTLLSLDVMGYSRAFLGNLSWITLTVSLFLLYPAGILADRYHPLRIMLLGLGIKLVFSPLGVLLPFLRPHLTLAGAQHCSIALSAINVPIDAIVAAGEVALFMRLFPQDRYGQYCSANAAVRSIAMIIGGFSVGYFLDSMKALDPIHPDLCYRFVPMWNFVFQSGYVFFYYLVYREWLRLGGMKGFVPPGSKPQVLESPRDPMLTKGH
jgi:maltose/moltooligosaccharide transporter